MNRRRVTVTACEGVPCRGRRQLWAFGYADLAELLGCSEAAVRQLVARGRLDPRSLRAVFEAWRAREERHARCRAATANL